MSRYKTQDDAYAGAYDDETIDTGLETLVRQEFKHEADVNYILNRFHVDPSGSSLRSHPPVYGEQDMQLELQTALQAVAQARESWRLMPPHIREKYGSWQNVLTAIEAGELTSLAEEKPKTDTPPPVGNP